jgi:cysteinyl-tRNA synthetase
MDDDLNISVAMASIFGNIKKVNILIQEKRIDADNSVKIVDAFRKIDSVLKIFDFGEAFSDSQVQRLMKEREKARAEKNWDLADKIRNQLRSRGIIIRDRKI